LLGRRTSTPSDPAVKLGIEPAPSAVAFQSRPR
jgi:hypothetical protein